MTYIPRFYKSLQLGVSGAILNGQSSIDITISAIDVNYTIIEPGGIRGYDNGTLASVGNWSVRYTLINSTTVRVQRNSSFTTGQIDVIFNVIEYLSAFVKSVQRGSITIGASVVSNTATIAAVNTAKSMAILSGISTDVNGPGYSAYIVALVFLDSSTTVFAARHNYDNVTTLVVEFQVLEFR